MSRVLVFLLFYNVVCNFSCVAYCNFNARRGIVYRRHRLHEKFVPPPPPEGGKGEWTDWDNENFMDDEFDVNESGSADPFFIIPTIPTLGNTSSKIDNIVRSQFEDSWSEEPPYFDEDDIDDYEDGKFSNNQNTDAEVNDKTYPNIEVSNKAFFASSFTPVVTADKPKITNTESINAEYKSPQQSAYTIIVTLETLRNLLIDQNKILQLKLQQSISDIEKNIILQSRVGHGVIAVTDGSSSSSDMNSSLKTDIANLSSKLNIVLAIVALLLIRDITSP